MRSNTKWIIPLILLAMISGVYFFPTPRRSFQDLAGDVPEAQVKAFLAFRYSFAVHRLEINGLKWEYITAGSGQEAFLFLHGLSGAYDIWWQQIQALRDNFRVISVTYPAVDSLEGLSDGVLAILDAEQVEMVNVVGTSLGGYLAQYLVANHPERILRAVFANTFPPNDAIRKEYALIGALLPFLPEWAIMSIGRWSILETVLPASGNDAFTRAYLLEMTYGRLSKAQVLARYKCVIEPFTPIDPIGQGVLSMIIETDNDPLLDETLRAQLRETYPGPTYGIKGAGHFPYLNRSDSYLALLMAFLALPMMR